MRFSFRNKRHRQRIRALKKNGLSGRDARRIARRENTKRNGRFSRRLFRGVKKVAPFALGAAGVGLATGIIGKGALGKGIFGKIGSAIKGKGQAFRVARRSLRKSKRLNGAGKVANLSRSVFKNRKRLRSVIKSASPIVAKQLTPKTSSVY